MCGGYAVWLGTHPQRLDNLFDQPGYLGGTGDETFLAWGTILAKKQRLGRGPVKRGEVKQTLGGYRGCLVLQSPHLHTLHAKGFSSLIDRQASLFSCSTDTVT